MTVGMGYLYVCTVVVVVVVVVVYRGVVQKGRPHRYVARYRSVSRSVHCLYSHTALVMTRQNGIQDCNGLNVMQQAIPVCSKQFSLITTTMWLTDADKLLSALGKYRRFGSNFLLRALRCQWRENISSSVKKYICTKIQS